MSREASTLRLTKAEKRMILSALRTISMSDLPPYVGKGSLTPAFRRCVALVMKLEKAWGDV